MAGAAGFTSVEFTDVEGADGATSAGLAWTTADCCIGAAGVSRSAFSLVGRDGAAFGVGTDCGMRLAIFEGTAPGGRGGGPSRRVMGSSGP